MLSENLVKDGELHYYIEGEGTKCFFGKVPSQLSNQTPNCLSTMFDDILWNDFKSRLNPLISQINRWLRLIFFIYAVAIIGTIVLCLLLDEQQIVFALIGLFYCLTILYFIAIRKNLSIDKEIKSILEDEHKDKVTSKGYSIECRTEWTGFSKPTTAVPKRVIVFPKLENVDDATSDEENPFSHSPEETQQKESNNGDIDREAWGLNYESTDNDGIDREAWGL